MALRAVLSIVGIGILCGAPACGDCLSIGYPAVDVTVVEASSGAPVDIGGAILIVTSSARRDSVDTSWQGGLSHFSVCCVSGTVRIQLHKPPYAAWDTTVVVRTSGHCAMPQEKFLVARLRRE